MASSSRFFDKKAASLLPQIKPYDSPRLYYMHFTLTCRKKKKFSGDTYVKWVKRISKNLQEGRVTGPTLELLRGMVHIHVPTSGS